MRCPKCRSTKIQKAGKVPTVKGGRKQRYRCSKCGTTFYPKKGGK